jgi:copper transport protein
VPGPRRVRDRAPARPPAGSGARRAVRLSGRLLAVALVAGALLLVTAVPASAHAVLESTDPTEGAVLATSPSQVVLHFDEAVEIDLGSVRVLAPGGQRVDQGNTFHPGGEASSVAVSLQPHLPDGTYVVAWRVVSADSHPVHGAFLFSVGTAAGVKKADALAGTLAGENAGSPVGVAFWLDRAVVLGSLLLLVGASLALPVAWPGGGRARRARRLLAVTWAAAMASTLLGIGLQGAYASALPLGDALRPVLWSAVVHTRFGEVALVRAGLLVLAVPALLVLAGGLRRLGPRVQWALLWSGAVIGLALLATPGQSGHASTGGAVAVGIPADLVHLISVSLWVGALAVLALVFLPGLPEPDRPSDPRRVAMRVSGLAFAGVSGIVVSGIVLAVRQVTSWSGLVGTTFGRLLLVKAGVVALVIALGAYARRRLHGRWLALPRPRHPGKAPAVQVPGPFSAPSGSAPDERRQLELHLRRTSVFELGGLAVVFGVTAALTNSVPPRQLQTQPYTATWNVLGIQVDAIVEPATAGPGNQFHFYVLGGEGQPKAIPELDVTISLPSQGIGPITVPLVVASLGHYQDDHVDLPFAGNWQMRVTVRTTAIDEQLIYATLPVR